MGRRDMSAPGRQRNWLSSLQRRPREEGGGRERKIDLEAPLRRQSVRRPAHTQTPTVSRQGRSPGFVDPPTDYSRMNGAEHRGGRSRADFATEGSVRIPR